MKPEKDCRMWVEGEYITPGKVLDTRENLPKAQRRLHYSSHVAFSDLAHRLT